MRTSTNISLARRAARVGAVLTAAVMSWAMLSVAVGAPAQASVTTIGVFTEDELTAPVDSREETFDAALAALPDPTDVTGVDLAPAAETVDSENTIEGVVDDVERLPDPEPDPGEETLAAPAAAPSSGPAAKSTAASSEKSTSDDESTGTRPAPSTDPSAGQSESTAPNAEASSGSAEPSPSVGATAAPEEFQSASPSSSTSASPKSAKSNGSGSDRQAVEPEGAEGAISALTTTPPQTPGSAGEGGDWSATSLAPSSTWGTSGATGGFTWSYPIDVPETAGGLVPQLGLSYSSASSDGRVASTNNQTSWVGEGFDLEPGFIERSYVPCDDDRDDKSGSTANNKTHRTGDLCWGVDNATLMLGGTSVALVKNDETGEWLPKDIDGTKIQHLSGAPAPDGVPAGLRDASGEYWKVTGVDGTVYYFGRDRAAVEGEALNSTWTTPVYGNHPGEPGYDSSFAASAVQQAWRWNLDYVVDPTGNSMTYFYGSNTAAYGADMGEKVRQYQPGGWLKRIEYGTREVTGGPDTPTNAPAKVIFETAAREWTDAGVTKTDVPTDLRCAADATECKEKVSPAFYTTKQLTGVRTEAAGAGQTVDEWQFGQSWFSPGDYSLGKGGTGRILRLDKITHTGRGGSTEAPDVTLPSVELGWVAMKNRLDTATDNAAGMWRPRLTTIRTESGASVSINYKGGCATKPAATDPGGDGGAGNKRLCFPVKWMSVDGDSAEPEPIIDWFQKYVVSSIVASGSSNPADAEILPTGSAPTETHYSYDSAGGAFWAEPVAAITDPKNLTHSEFRGFRWVKTSQGVGTEATSPVQTFYYRGKASQTLTAGAEGHKVSVADNEDVRVGDVFATVSFNDGKKVSETVTKTNISAPVVTKGKLEATRVTGSDDYGFSYDATGDTSNGLDFRTLSSTTFDEHGQPTKVSNRGDLGTDADDTCTRMAYAHRDPTAPAGLANQRSLVWRTQTLNTTAADVGACPSSADLDAVAPSDLLSEEIVKLNADGIPVETWAIDPKVATTSTTVGAVKAGTMDGAGRDGMVRISKSTPDALGRTVSETLYPDDSSVDRTTSTTYAPAGAGLVERVTTSQGDIDGEAGWRPVFKTSKKYDPFLGVVLEATDLNDKVTEATYDGLGRLLTVTYPQHASLDKASVKYAYIDRANGINAVTTETLNAHGDGYHTAVAISDGLGRELQTQAESANTGDSYQNRSKAVDTRVMTHTVYNTAGEKEKTYGPWLSVVGKPTAELLNYKTIVEPDKMVSWLYDRAGRVTDEILWSDPSTNGYDEKWRTLTAYNGKATTVTPPQGGIKTTTIVDALGQTRIQRQHDGTATQDTSYTYDQAGQLIGLKDPAGTTWSYTYDFAGRQTLADDPDAGKTATTYTSDGQPKTVTNGAGKTIAYTYDKLGRPLTMRDDTTAGKIRVEHAYDGDPESDPDTAGMLGMEHATTRHTSEGNYTTRTGKVDAAYRPLTTTLDYPQAATGDNTGEGSGPTGDIPEALARLSTESASVDYTYMADGQIKSQTTSKVAATDSATILGSERVTTFYDQASKPRWMGGGFGWGTYVADSHYDDLGRLELADLGNTYSAALSRTYDPTTGRLTNQMLKREGIAGNDLNQTYKYSDSGNITEITDTPTNTALGGDAGVGARGEKQCFVYDNLARLKHAWTPALGTECGTGDPGNPALAGPAPYQIGYTYNPLNSNRETQTYRNGLTGVTETTDYDYTQTGNAGPHAVTSITGTTKAANGTVTPLAPRAFTYTATGGQETRTGTEIPEVAVPEPDVLDVDYTDGNPADDAQGRTMTKHGTPAVIDDTTLDAARRTKLGLAGSKVAKFDGVDDAYSYAMGDAQWDKLTDEMSIECLLKDNGTLPNATEHPVCSAKEGGGASMVVYNGKLTFTIYTDGGYRQAQADITAGKWYHAIGTWDGDTARLYVDGQLAASIEAPGPLKRPGNLGRNGFFVGADASSTTAGQYFSPVSVAKMGLYSQALSATEIAAIHNGARTAEGAAARRSVAQAMCWDREGELVKTLTTGETCETGVVDELGEAEYVYTGAGERIIRADAEAVTIYLPGGQEVTIPRDETRNVSAHRYYTFNGETIAVRDERGLGGVTSLVNDHHGTPIVSIPNTTWTPASVRKQYAEPFGAARGKEASASVDDRDANGTPGDRGFLGKSNDTTGLTQVGARYYDQATGAFVSPDPVLDTAEPSQFNAYGYSYQNPVTNTDPTGLHTDIGGGGSRDRDSDCFPGSAGCGESGSSSSGSSSGSGDSSGGGGGQQDNGKASFTNDVVKDVFMPLADNPVSGLVAAMLALRQILADAAAGHYGSVVKKEGEWLKGGEDDDRLKSTKSAQVRAAKIAKWVGRIGVSFSIISGAASQWRDADTVDDPIWKRLTKSAITGAAAGAGTMLGGSAGATVGGSVGSLAAAGGSLCGGGAPACGAVLGAGGKLVGTFAGAIVGGAVGSTAGVRLGTLVNSQW